MTRPDVSSGTPRRTQEERSAATRNRLLEATIDCLVQYGYAGTTTTRLAASAGVSRGAQGHHFTNRAELMAEAMRYIALKRRDSIHGDLERLNGAPQPIDAVLDLMWELHTGPLFQAAFELWSVARTDHELRATLVPIEAQVAEVIFDGAAQLFGEQAQRPHFTSNLHVTLATMRGLAMLKYMGRDRADEQFVDSLVGWETAKRRLVALFAASATG